MRNLKNTIITTAAVASLTISSFALADGFETVLPKVQSDATVSVTSSQDQYGPVTIADHVKLTLVRYNAEQEYSYVTGVDSNSVSEIEDIRNIKDML